MIEVKQAIKCLKCDISYSSCRLCEGSMEKCFEIFDKACRLAVEALEEKNDEKQIHGCS